MSVSGVNLRAVVEAKEHHDATCRFGARAREVHMNPADVERCGWEDGDDIAGLLLVSNPRRRAGFLRVYCDAELNESLRLETAVAIGSSLEVAA